MGRESSFWKQLRATRLPGHWERVENAVAVGTPDVSFSFEEAVGHVEGWIELKCIDSFPKRPLTPVVIPHYTDDQRRWLRRRWDAGGNCFLLLKVIRPAEYFLFKGHVAASPGMGAGWTATDLRAHAAWLLRGTFSRDALLKAIAANGRA